MKSFNKFFLFLFSFFIPFFFGCKEKQETSTKGYAKCYADESLFNVIQDERDLFVELYKQSKIDLVKVSAREGIAAVLNGETKMFVSSRNLNQEEADFVKKINSGLKIFKFCYDGVTLIVNPSLNLENLTVAKLKEFLLGQKRTFKIVIPERNSGIYEYIKVDLLQNREPVNVVVVKNEKEVIEKIKKEKNVIGIVGFNMLKDVKGVKIVKVGTEEKSVLGSPYHEPSAGSLINGAYPLVRTNYILLNEFGLGVASGFTTFLTSYQGQKIVSKHNLGPATVPVRLVQLNQR